MKRRVAEAFEMYRRDVIPLDAGEIQVTESRRAFYAGAHALFRTLTSHVSPGATNVTDDDLDMMDEINGELEQFNAAVKGGMA